MVSCMKEFQTKIAVNAIRGRSQTTLTRRGGQVVQKCQLFVIVYKVKNVNAGG